MGASASSSRLELDWARPGVLAALLLALTNVVAAVAAEGTGVRFIRLCYELGHAGVWGLVAVGAQGAWRALGSPGPKVTFLVLTVCSIALGFVVLPEDLAGFTSRTAPANMAGTLTVGLCVLLPSGVSIAWALTRVLRRIWWLALLVALAGHVANHIILPQGYPAAHLFVTFASFVIATTAIAHRDSRLGPSRSFLYSGAVGGMVGAAIASVVFAPSDTVVMRMVASEGSSLAPYIQRFRGLLGSPGKAKSRDDAFATWMKPRDEVGPRPPTKGFALRKEPIVILITIDSLRADFLFDKKNHRRMPTLARWERESVSFTQARTPGAQTVVTLASLFAGTYFSQQYWSEYEGRHLFPHEDETVRFPQLLQKAGVRTFTQASTRWLINDWGIVRGFDDDPHVPGPRKWYTRSDALFGGLRKALARHKKGPGFFFAHVLDAHYTVSPRGKKSKPVERFWLNLETVDKHLKRLEAFLAKRRLEDRTTIIVSADHGEGFGEHKTKHHSNTLYEELIHVPLLVKHPKLSSRRIDTPVSVIDLGPTILDHFGVSVPGHFMGESLVPLLMGKDVELNRPIVAEGHLKRALVFPDGWKLILDDRHSTRELYNLETDPDEANNLIDLPQAKGAERAAVMERFFEVHRIKKPGYEIPFRR